LRKLSVHLIAIRKKVPRSKKMKQKCLHLAIKDQQQN